MKQCVAVVSQNHVSDVCRLPAADKRCCHCQSYFPYPQAAPLQCFLTSS